MNKEFEKKLSLHFETATLEKPDAAQYIKHIYADFVELNALYYKEEVTLADISDLLIDVKDSNITESRLNLVVKDEIASLKTETDDIISARIRAIYDICKQRHTLFDEDEYPFEVTETQIKIKPEVSEKQKVYIFLLLSASLSQFNAFEYELTKEFELLSYRSLESFLPDKSIVRSFGKNSSYSGNAITKIRTLADHLGVNNNENKLKHISTHNVQERGLDLIAWVPFADKIPNMLIFLGQCACGKNWDDKLKDTEFFAGYFHFNNKSPVHSMFVPYALSSPDNEFMHSDRILDNLFFDRKRIIEHLESVHFLKEFQTYDLVDKCIQTRISIN